MRPIRIKKSKDVELFGRINGDICNVPKYLIPRVRLQVKLTDASSNFYVKNKDAESKFVFKFVDARLYVKRFRPKPTLSFAHNATLANGTLARYNNSMLTLETFPFSASSQSLSKNNAVLGLITKHLLFTMVKDTDYLGLVSTNPYQFRHFDLSYFSLNVNGKYIPTKVLSTNLGHKKTSVSF